jgi:hypothetical protein
MKLLAKIGAFSMLGIALSYGQPAGTDDAAEKPVAKAGASVSFPEMLSEAQVVREQVLADFRHVKHLQEQARKDKDVIKLNCVNDKLVQMKPQMNLADAAQAALTTSEPSADRNALFAEVTIAGENIRRLREEADQCIGEPTLATESQSGYTGPTMPDNPYQNPFDPNIEPPGYASPYN